MKPTIAKTVSDQLIRRNYARKTVTYLLSLLFAVAATCVQAADSIVWSGAAGDGKWETDGNWKGNVKPTGAEYAKFSEPYGEDLTVTISDTVSVYGLSTSSSRTGTVTLTGDGLLDITSDYLRANRYGSIVWDVNVTNTIDNKWVSLYGDNTFLRRLDMISGSSGNTFCIRDNATLRLAGNASARTKYINLQNYTNPSIYLSGNSSFEIQRELFLKSDATLSVANNASLTVQSLYAYSDATLSVADNASIAVQNLHTAHDANISFTGGTITTPVVVSNATLLAANEGTILVSTYNSSSDSAFLPFSDTVDTWTLNGGTVRDVSGGRINMVYTNATKEIVGSGVIEMDCFDTTMSSNIVLRVYGVDLYLKNYSQWADYKKKRDEVEVVDISDVQFQVGGGTTLGVRGSGDKSFQYWHSALIDGSVTVDTTDHDDHVSGRTVKLGGLTGNGKLGIVGAGNVTFGTSSGLPGETWSYDMAGVSVSLCDSVTATVPSGCPIYNMGDFELSDSASLTTPYYMGKKNSSAPVGYVRSLTMSDATSLDVGRFMLVSGDATLSGSAKAVVRHTSSSDAEPTFSCANLSLSDDASLVVTGQIAAAAVSLSGDASLVVTGKIAAASLSMSGNAHLAFTAGTGFTAGAAFEGNGWTMEITIPDNYDAGIHPIVRGVAFDDDFTNRVTIVGATEGWSVKVLDGVPALYKALPASGVEWIGGGATSDWSDSANWNNGELPTAGDKVAFGGADGLKPFDNDYLTTVSGLVFRASAGPFVITGSVDTLTMTEAFPSGSRSSVTQDNATILSLSDFDQEIAVPVRSSGETAVLAAGGGAITLSQGITAPTDKYLVVGGEVCLGGTSETDYLAFRSKNIPTTSTLRLLPGSTYTIRRQGYHSFTDEANYVGRFVIEEGATMNVVDGDCASNNGDLEYVVDGTLNVTHNKDTGRLVAGPVEQYYTGKGSIYADSARSSRFDSTGHYINFGGTLKLYMGGNWYTATYTGSGENPNYPTRFRMMDGTTLGAANDWIYGPMNDVDSQLAPAQRASIMVGTVTVNTQNPTNDTAHTITFVDPLDASAANVVKVGAGTLAFNAPENYSSQISNLTVNAGVVQFTGAAPTIDSITANAGTVRFAAAPTLSGALTIASTDANFCVDGVAATAAWEPLAAAADIVGPDSETKWKTADGMRRFKIVSEVAGKVLYGAQASGFTVILR